MTTCTATLGEHVGQAARAPDKVRAQTRTLRMPEGYAFCAPTWQVLGGSEDSCTNPSHFARLRRPFRGHRFGHDGAQLSLEVARAEMPRRRDAGGRIEGRRIERRDGRRE